MREVILDLGKDLEDFVRREVESGNYNSVNELIIDALTDLEKFENDKSSNLKNALQDGINSGFKPYNSEKFVDKMNKKLAN